MRDLDPRWPKAFRTDGRVARRSDKDERERGERQGLAARGDPVRAGSCVAPEDHEGTKDDQQAVARHPQDARPRIQHRAPDRAGLERGFGPALEQRGLSGQDDEAGRKRDDHEPPRCAQNPPFPPARGLARGRSCEQQQEERACEQHALGKMDPFGSEQQGRHSTEKANRPSLTWPSTERTRQSTVYVPGASGSSDARRSNGLEGSTWASLRSTWAPRSSLT